MKKTIVLILAIVFMFSAVLAGCAGKPAATQTSSTPEATQEATQTPEASATAEATATPDVVKEVVYKESPFLAGKGLPPVKDRLPKEPKLSNAMPPDQIKYEIGTFGGVVRTVTAEPTFDALVFCMQNTPLLNTPGMLGKEVTPNVLKAYEVSADQMEYTFHLREGLKWSDGQPVTTDDFKFAIEDVLMNKELSPSGLPTWLLSGGIAGGTPMVFKVQDQFTFTIKFDKPYGGFPLTLSIEGWRGYTDILKPKHFMTKYHTKYTPLKDLEPAIKAAKFKPGDWVNLFNLKDCLNWSSTVPKAIGFPALTPWLLTKKVENVSEYERNPYYFKVDEEGNQLPYIDKVQSTYVMDLEIVAMKVLAGEVDHSSELLSPQKLELLKANEAKGGYTMYLPKLHRTGGDIMLNLTYKNANWRKVVQDVRFRQALNFALDRPEIVSTAYNGIAKPTTFQGTDFNLAAGNKLLDEMGMKKGADGFRVGPDGKKFVLPFECAPHRPEIMATAQIVVEQLRLLGLDVPLKQVDATLWTTRNAANELQATIMWSSGPVMWTWPDWGQAYWAPLWTQWMSSGGKLGEEPPADAKKLLMAIEGMRALSVEEGNKKAEEIRADFKANLWYFVLADDIGVPVAINSKMRNYTNNGFNIAQFFGPDRWFYAK